MSLLDKIKRKFGFNNPEDNKKISSELSSETKFEKWEDYLYPGTNILKNKFNLKDYDLLALAENWHTTKMKAQLNENPIEGNFDCEHLKKFINIILKKSMNGLVKYAM